MVLLTKGPPVRSRRPAARPQALNTRGRPEAVLGGGAHALRARLLPEAEPPQSRPPRPRRRRLAGRSPEPAVLGERRSRPGQAPLGKRPDSQGTGPRGRACRGKEDRGSLRREGTPTSVSGHVGVLGGGPQAKVAVLSTQA